MKASLTDTYLRNLKPPARRLEVTDESFRARGALVFRVTPKGFKSFAYRYRNLAGMSRRFTVGPYPAVSLAKARQGAYELAAKVALGEDPMEEKLSARGAARESLTFEKLAALYLRDHAGRHKSKKSQHEDKRIIYRDLLPTWRRRDIRSISRGNVVELLDAIVSRGAPVMANRVYSLVSKMFVFAMQKAYLPEGHPSPCMSVKPPGGQRRAGSGSWPRKRYGNSGRCWRGRRSP